MAKNYNHIISQVTTQPPLVTEFDWANNLIKRSVSQNTFDNPLTGDFALVLERLYYEFTKNIELIEKYKRP